MGTHMQYEDTYSSMRTQPMWTHLQEYNTELNTYANTYEACYTGLPLLTGEQKQDTGSAGRRTLVRGHR